MNDVTTFVLSPSCMTTSVGVDKMPLRQRKLTTFSHRKLTQLYPNKFTFQIRCANVFPYVVPQRCGDVRLSQQNAVELAHVKLTTFSQRKTNVLTTLIGRYFASWDIDSAFKLVVAITYSTKFLSSDRFRHRTLEVITSNASTCTFSSSLLIF